MISIKEVLFIKPGAGAVSSEESKAVRHRFAHNILPQFSLAFYIPAFYVNIIFLSSIKK